MCEATEKKMQQGASLSQTLLSVWMLRTGCWKYHLATHEESSDGGQGDEGEDALRMGVKTKVLCYTTGSVVTLVMRNVFLHSFLPSSNNYELTPW